MKTIFTCLFVSLVFIASAQSTFKTRIFSHLGPYLEKVTQLIDGSLVSVGFIGEAVDYNQSILLVKTSAAGTVLASKQIRIAGVDEDYFYNSGSDIVATSDGGFAVIGTLNRQMVLLKFNADLSLQWKQEYDAGTGYSSGGSALVQTADGGYLLAGSVSGGYYSYAGFLVKTDSLGVIRFQKRYFDFHSSSIDRLSPTPDGNYAFLATSLGRDRREPDTSFIGKIKPDGTLLWVNRLYDTAYSYLPLDAITGTSDGGVVTGGFSESNSGYSYGMTMVKFNAGGGVAWSQVLQDSALYSAVYSIAEDKDGGYLFAGIGNDYTTNFALVVKTSSSGALLWKKTFERNTDGSGSALIDVIATADGGFAGCGVGTFGIEEDDYDYAGIIYKYNSGFDICSETAGTTSGSLVNFGTGVSDTLTQSDIALTTITPNLTIIDIVDTVKYPCSSLPVHFTSFNASLQNKSVAVQWTTANEINTSYFTVERSKNAASFTALQQVTAKGNSAGVQSYTTTDFQPLPGTSYYRLKEVDKDGNTTYSSVVPVTVLSNGVIIISPNPVQNSIRVIMQSTANASVTCQVIDMKGRVLATQKTSVTTGRNEIAIPAASLAKGVYMLKVIENNATQTIRFVKE